MARGMCGRGIPGVEPLIYRLKPPIKGRDRHQEQSDRTNETWRGVTVGRKTIEHHIFPFPEHRLQLRAGPVANSHSTVCQCVWYLLKCFSVIYSKICFCFSLTHFVFRSKVVTVTSEPEKSWGIFQICQSNSLLSYLNYIVSVRPQQTGIALSHHQKRTLIIWRHN